jgi:hypothetical protein
MAVRDDTEVGIDGQAAGRKRLLQERGFLRDAL